MNKSSKLFLSILAISVCLALAGCRLYPEATHEPPNIVSISQFDSIFSRDINLATSMADIPTLREASLNDDDIEVRIWRAFDVSTLEGVFLKRTGSEWSALHIRFRTVNKGDIQGTEVKQLPEPEEGWESFWGKIVDKGLLRLPISPEGDCETKYIDGILYFVEISQKRTYRNFQYTENDNTCRSESKQMTEIGEIIGLEFDSGEEECTRYEWFACMVARKNGVKSK